MIRPKTIFIIPGYKHKSTNKPYREITKMLKKEGYNPIVVNIPWKKSTISQNAQYFLKEFNKRLSISSKSNKKKRNKTYILGYSFGAMIAFIVSTKVNVSGLILCSLSPYFKEDVSKISARKVLSIAKFRYDDFSKLRSSTLVKQIKTKQVRMLYGAKEDKLLIKRVTNTYHKINLKNKYLISIKGTEHNIGDKRYLNSIHQTISTLN